MNDRPGIIITDIDERRISRLLDLKAGELDAFTLERLEGELSTARVVSAAEVPPTVVTMNSVVLFEDVETGQRSELTLVYPSAGPPGPGRVSVLAPIGAALLGLAVGASIDWPVPGGRSRHLRVLEVRYQPEAAGRLDS
jgi:regulator of nucleoside diphosphate kinase